MSFTISNRHPDNNITNFFLETVPYVSIRMLSLITWKKLFRLLFASLYQYICIHNTRKVAVFLKTISTCLRLLFLFPRQRKNRLQECVVATAVKWKCFFDPKILENEPGDNSLAFLQLELKPHFLGGCAKVCVKMSILSEHI